MCPCPEMCGGDRVTQTPPDQSLCFHSLKLGGNEGIKDRLGCLEEV